MGFSPAPRGDGKEGMHKAPVLLAAHDFYLEEKVEPDCLAFCAAVTRRVFISLTPSFNGLRSLAEGGGFEPPEPCGSTVFKTVAIVHSAIPPGVIIRQRLVADKQARELNGIDRLQWH